MRNSKIISTGGYLPTKVYDNDYMASIVDTSDEWITTRTGIKKRHIAADDELTTDLALKACMEAINKINFDVNEIDAIVMATTTPDRTFPSSAVILQNKLGIGSNCFSFDVQAVCCGFIYAIDIADSLIKTEKADNVLVVGAETISRIIDWTDRNSCVLFGDGAGAIILQATKDRNMGIISTLLHSDGQYFDLLNTDGGVSTNQLSGKIKMKGSEVFKLAVNKMSECILEGLHNCGLSKNDINLLIPHQANQRIINGIAKKLELDDSKVVSTISEHGNTSGASIPLALNQAIIENRVKEGDIIVLEGLGGGLTWGSIILRW